MGQNFFAKFGGMGWSSGGMGWDEKSRPMSNPESVKPANYSEMSSIEGACESPFWELSLYMVSMLIWGSN